MAHRRPTLKKRYGQHHLVRGDLCRPLLDFLRPAGQRVVEIGPGGGVLTRELLAAKARVLAFEVDLDWGFRLPALLDRSHGAVGEATADLAVVVTDALKQPWSRLPVGTLVTGNLPFNVGTRMIETLLPHHERVPRAAFMVQKEVADRMVAPPGSKTYGVLSVLVALHARAVDLGSIKPGSFRPPPKVSAGFVGLELRPCPYADEELADFHALVRLAFAQRRKTLRNTLGSGWGRDVALTALERAGIDPGRRAETLGLDDFEQLHHSHRRLVHARGCQSAR